MIKIIPKKKKCKKAKWLSEEALKIARNKRSERQRRKRRIYPFQCKEIEENNRMGKTRVLFKKIRDIKETFHVRMGMIKGRNSKDLTETEAEDIKNR